MELVETLRSALSDRYSLGREIGAGGMATVYLARDLRHDRDVALKVLKPELGAVLGPERFLSEIRVTAKLQHPNLLPLFDSGEIAGQLFYVMPYVDGENLRSRLARERQLSVREAVRIASAVAGALDFAHRHGVIHRDLKPENILLQDGQPLVADFGIALAVSNAGGERVTQTGLSLGTPQYMSPEQATGERAIDGRSDIYSLGAVLYEMLIGEPPHTGATVQAIIARVLTETTRNVRASRPSIPENVDRAVAKALEKVPADRFESASEFAEVLQGQRAITGATSSAQRGEELGTVRARLQTARVMAAVAGAAILGAGVAATLVVRSTRARDPAAVSFVLNPAAGERIEPTSLAITRDGAKVAYVGNGGGARRIYLRQLGDVTPHPILGTEGAEFPFFSPDGKTLGFFAGGELRRIPVDGGPSLTVARGVTAAPASWMDGGRILVSTLTLTSRRGGVSEISATGGTMRTLIASDSAHGENAAYPLLLEDGHTVLFKSQGPGGFEDDYLAVGSLDKHDRTVTNLLVARPLAYVDGYVICTQWQPPSGVALAIPLDIGSRKITGDPILLQENIGGGDAALSSSGTLAYVSGRAFTELTWSDASGAMETIIADPGVYIAPRLSRDGTKLAFLMPGTRSSNLWIYDIVTKTKSRFTAAGSLAPEWAPDGKRIIYIRPRTANPGIWIQRIDGSAPPEPLRPRLPAGVSTPTFAVVAPDNETVMFTAPAGTQRTNIYYFRPSSDADSVHVWLATTDNVIEPRFSPDGKWVSYSSNESGTFEVYVRAFPGGGPRIQISTSGGDKPQWSVDGRTIYFHRGPLIVAASVSATPSFSVLSRRTAFTVASAPTAPSNAVFDVSADGKRAVFARAAGGDSRVIVTTNWLADARKRLREARH